METLTTKILNSILSNLDTKERVYNKNYKQQEQKAKKGKIKARIFLNKYSVPIFCLPIHYERFYEFEKPKYKELTQEQFLTITKLENTIKKLQTKKGNLIKTLLKDFKGLGENNINPLTLKS